jgi:hypothetical protein
MRFKSWALGMPPLIAAGAVDGGATIAAGAPELATAGACTRYPTASPSIRQIPAML